MPEPYYPRYHQNEIWDAPEWVFAKGVSVGPRRAARTLGMSPVTLVHYADQYGITVYRNPRNGYRRFLVSEVEELKRKLGAVTAADVRRGRRGKNAVFLQAVKG